jgi:methyl-accepting chemotaxis protein
MGIKKMQEKDSPKFQLGKDDGVHDEMLQNELQELKMEKLNHRVTLLTILIPCMIGIILIIAYLDIKERVTRTQDTGTIGAQKLAKDIESKFSSLSLEQAKIKETLATLPSLENSSAFVQSRLKNMQNSLKQLESSSISRDELARVVQGINDNLNEIPTALKTELQNLKTTNGQLADNTDKLSGRFNQLSDSLKEIKERMKRIDERIAAMEVQKINKDEVDLALRLKEIATRQSILETATSLEKKIHSLEEKIHDIQKNAGGDRQNSQSNDTRESGPVKEQAADAPEQPNQTSGPAVPVQKKPGKPADGQSPPVESEPVVEQNIE